MSIIAVTPKETQPTTVDNWQSARFDENEVEWASDPLSSVSKDVSLRALEVSSSIADITQAYAQFPKYWTPPYSYRYAMSAPSMSCFRSIASQKTMVLIQPSWRGLIDAEHEERLSEIVKKSVVRRLSPLSDDVRQFLEGRNLVPHFSRFFNLASSAFDVQRCATSFQVHPEEQGIEWIELEVSVEGETNLVLKQYNKFLKSTSANIPSDALQWFRLSLNIL